MASNSKRHGFIAFIDESGQEGGKGNTLSSDFFVISAVVCRTTKGQNPITEAFEKAAKEAGKGPGWRYQKFNKAQRNAQWLYAKHLGAARIQIATIICHKASFQKDTMLTKNGDLYFYASQLLLERISWICRDAHEREPSGNGKCAMVFSRRRTLDYERFQGYAERIKVGDCLRTSNADWAHLDLRAITSRPHSSGYDGLLAADYVASCYGAALELSPYGLHDDHLVRPLSRRSYRSGLGTGKSWSNGLKIFPKEAEALVASDQHLWWIRDFHQK